MPARLAVVVGEFLLLTTIPTIVVSSLSWRLSARTCQQADARTGLIFQESKVRPTDFAATLALPY